MKYNIYIYIYHRNAKSLIDNLVVKDASKRLKRKVLYMRRATANNIFETLAAATSRYAPWP